MYQDAIIKLLGKKLATKINTKVMPSIGFIRLALKDDYGEIETLSVEKLIYTIKNGLRKRLEAIHFENVNEIVGYLLKELIDNQSLITASNI
ncbi:MAG: hypothetical protein ACFFAS_13545 [Promethearchaeota archaeon]